MLTLIWVISFGAFSFTVRGCVVKMIDNCTSSDIAVLLSCRMAGHFVEFEVFLGLSSSWLCMRSRLRIIKFFGTCFDVLVGSSWMVYLYLRTKFLCDGPDPMSRITRWTVYSCSSTVELSEIVRLLHGDVGISKAEYACRCMRV